MAKKPPFDLSYFLTNSLNLQANISSPTRSIFPPPPDDSYSNLLEQDPLDVLGESNIKPRTPTSEDTVGTPIQEFFRGANVLITGGTGFIGKILTEKLVRSIPHLGHIYLLVRDKRGRSSKERYDQLLEQQVFLRMRTEVPNYQEKITLVDGDLSKPDLGLSVEDRQMLMDRVNVVFHSAADVRFIEPLRVAIESNVLGSKRILDLAKAMKNLKSYVHVSTAFSQCVRRLIKEEIPKMSISYSEILNHVKEKTDEELEEDTRIMQGWPNTYTFSKAVCEDLIQEEAGTMPICVFRPSVVGSTYKEPVRGWTDNVYGPIGLLLGATFGVLHCFRIDQDLPIEGVPVDYAVNCMIAAAWRTGTLLRDHDDIPVYNYTSTPVKLRFWKDVVDFGDKFKDVWPMSQALWYFSFMATKSYVLDDIANIFLHKIPGKIFDTLAVMFGEKPRLSKIYDRIQTLKKPLRFFSTKIWEFENNNVIQLLNSLSEEDRIEFGFDLSDADLLQYTVCAKLGIRYYYVKDKMETIPAAKSKANRLYWVHNSMKMIFGLTVLKVFVYVAHVLPI